MDGKITCNKSYLVIEEFIVIHMNLGHYKCLDISVFISIFCEGMLMVVCLWCCQNFLSIPYESQYMLMISSAWIYMRCQSYCLDRLPSAGTGPSVSDLVMMLGYCFYFPMLFLGPLVLYEEFEAGVQKPYAPWTVQRIKIFVLNMLRYSWWMLFLELFLHFIYVGALQMEVEVCSGVLVN